MNDDFKKVVNARKKFVDFIDNYCTFYFEKNHVFLEEQKTLNDFKSSDEKNQMFLKETNKKLRDIQEKIKSLSKNSDNYKDEITVLEATHQNIVEYNKSNQYECTKSYNQLNTYYTHSITKIKDLIDSHSYKNPQYLSLKQIIKQTERSFIKQCESWGEEDIQKHKEINYKMQSIFKNINIFTNEIKLLIEKEKILNINQEISNEKQMRGSNQMILNKYKEILAQIQTFYLGNSSSMDLSLLSQINLFEKNLINKPATLNSTMQNLELFKDLQVKVDNLSSKLFSIDEKNIQIIQELERKKSILMKNAIYEDDLIWKTVEFSICKNTSYNFGIIKDYLRNHPHRFFS